jgi:hypothetical protein
VLVNPAERLDTNCTNSHQYSGCEPAGLNQFVSISEIRVSHFVAGSSALMRSGSTSTEAA